MNTKYGATNVNEVVTENENEEIVPNEIELR